MTINLFLKDLSSKKIFESLDSGEVELYHGYMQLGWLNLSDKEDAVAEFTSYHGDKSRGNYYGEKWEIKVSILKQGKMKTKNQILDALESVAGYRY